MSEALQERRTGETHCQSGDWLRKTFWGILLIYLGVLLLLVKMEILWEDEWIPYFIFGLGALLVIEYLYRLLSPQLETAGTPKLILGILLILFSANGLDFIADWWPLILIAVGVLLIWIAWREEPNRAGKAEPQRGDHGNATNG